MGFRTIFVKVVLENPLETILFMVIPLVFYTSSAFLLSIHYGYV